MGGGITGSATGLPGGATATQTAGFRRMNRCKVPWWPEWGRWLARHSSGAMAARAPGSHADHPALADAPGTYIHQT
jgi:poly(3-hydroxyalkanoate) synthetase